MNILRRIKGFVQYRILPSYNMFTNKAEQFYFEEYFHVIKPYFGKGKTLLDIGCQYGRFTIPAARAGLKVTATDIHSKYFTYIKKQLKDTEIQFRKESIAETCSSAEGRLFDIVVCTELLYNLPSPEQFVLKLSALVKPGGVLLVSHRTKGYYIYRFLKEKKFEDIQHILGRSHMYYNAQSREELIKIYSEAGFSEIKISPVGIFSGFGNDSFACFANPGKVTSPNRESLFHLETNKELQQLFGENARYWLVCAVKHSL